MIFLIDENLYIHILIFHLYNLMAGISCLLIIDYFINVCILSRK